MFSDRLIRGATFIFHKCCLFLQVLNKMMMFSYFDISVVWALWLVIIRKTIRGQFWILACLMYYILQKWLKWRYSFGAFSDAICQQCPEGEMICIKWQVNVFSSRLLTSEKEDLEANSNQKVRHVTLRRTESGDKRMVKWDSTTDPFDTKSVE